mmetsp:Transcript_60190/g.135458  ORF Transcript_60190/g.135458 Transcript_60190/m.135458 type:complete len:209 (+) Transcript_60190:58-684(+)
MPRGAKPVSLPPGLRNPWHDHLHQKQTNLKEGAFLGQAMQKEQLRIVGALSHNGSYRHNGNPRQPVIGEQVTVSGLRNRPHLNGAQAEILKSGLDSDGYVRLRVLDDNGLRSIDGGGTKMKVRAKYLWPATNSSSVPSLASSRPTSTAASFTSTGVKSVRSASVGSIASGVSRRTGRSSGASNRAAVACVTPICNSEADARSFAVSGR